MKKFVSILVSLALVFAFASIGLFAQQMPNTTSGSTAVTYRIDPIYIVNIPDTVSVGGDLSIRATSINCEPGYCVVVRIASGITDHSSILLVRQDAFGNTETPNDTNVLETFVALNTGSVNSTTRFAEFNGNSIENHITALLEMGSFDTAGKLAGTYKGTLTFSISYESEPV